MKIHLQIIFFLFVVIYGCNVQGQTISFMSYNIRYDTPNDKENWWENRRAEVVDLIEFYHPDFFGIQEGLYRQVNYLEQHTSNYAYIGVGRDDGKTKGEYTALFYDTTQFEVLEQNTFWLSDTPHEVSVGWDASMERICTYGKFKYRKTGEQIYVFNTHFDHQGPEARAKSAQLILSKIGELSLEKSSVVVMGDLNCIPESEPIQVFNKLLDDGQKVAVKKTYGPVGTFNGFDPMAPLDRRIDYIFTKNLKVRSYRHIDDRRQNNLCISDHLPVLIEANFSSKY